MTFYKNKLTLKSAYKLKVISVLLLLINIYGCELSSDEIYVRESQGWSSIHNMNQAQKYFLFEKNRFAETFDQLRLNTDSKKNRKLISQSAHYVFKIIPQPSNTKSVMHIAQAKNSIFTNPDIESYIGVVYLIGDSDRGTIMTLLCSTSKNLSVPPQMPKLAQKYEDIECPSGFEFNGKSSEGIYKKTNK